MNIREIFETMEYGPAPEDARQAMAWLDGHGRHFGLFIDGKWVRPKGAATFACINPADERTLATATQGTKAHIARAVKAARRAQGAWEAAGGSARARVLYALARGLQKRARLFAVLETLDNGKPIRETRDIDIPLAIRHFYHHAGWAQIYDERFGDYHAMGVAGQIIPWNFPLLMLAWKIAPALAAGNTVVLKPAEQTCLGALAFAELCREAGVPAGVVNIVTGDGRTGAALVASDVDKIAFTGSTQVGRQIRRASAGSGKHITLELGGKSPFIVFDDADLDGAVEGLVDSIWFNQGEVCCAGSRALIQESIADTLIARIKRRLANYRVGDPLDKAIDMGAIIDETQLKRIKSLVAAGRREGAKVWTPKIKMPRKGYYYPPTLISDAAPANTLACEEIFGPVLTAMTFRTPDEAVALANNTRYGLAASVWTENVNLALHIAPQLKAGVVWVNCANQFDAGVGFGGYRESGNGREGGVEGMMEYLTLKTSPVKPAAAPRRSKRPQKPAIDVDRTAKHYIGGRQTRPDNGHSLGVTDYEGAPMGVVPDGNRKDVRNAVAAARKGNGWSRASAHLRAQVLYYVGENLAARQSGFADRLRVMTGMGPGLARRHVTQAIDCWFVAAAWADKYEGRVHQPPLRAVALAMHEPFGVAAIVCPDEAPLLSFSALLAPALAMGNRVVIVPSERHPLIATDFIQVLETSDIPAGAVNILTGWRDTLIAPLADHDDVDAMWCFASPAHCMDAQIRATGNLKAIHCSHGRTHDWLNSPRGWMQVYLRQLTQVKNIWVPYGE